MQEPAIPNDRNGYGSAIHEMNNQKIIRYHHIFNPLIGSRSQDAHSKPPKAFLAVQQ
jgi:hypothetical protein